MAAAANAAGMNLRIAMIVSPIDFGAVRAPEETIREKS
jgi:hypothetical protein